MTGALGNGVIGNTAVSGTVIQGSSPCSPTKSRHFLGHPVVLGAFRIFGPHSFVLNI